jgi:hypothetical protein
VLNSDSSQFTTGSGWTEPRRYPDYSERAHAVLSREGGPTSLGAGVCPCSGDRDQSKGETQTELNLIPVAVHLSRNSRMDDRFAENRTPQLKDQDSSICF